MRIKGFVLIVIVSIFYVNSLHAQDTSSTVRNLYFVSVAHPESFDDSLDLDLAKLNPQGPLVCLDAIQSTYYALAKAVIDHCQNAYGAGTKKEWECIKDDQNASLAYWANGMISVVNEDKSWVNTFTGSNMLIAKAIAEQIQHGFWVETVKMSMPIIQKMISCS